MSPKKKRGNVTAQERSKKIKATWRSPCAHGHFCQSRKNSSPLKFLSILERKHFSEPEEKTLGSHYLFSFLPTQPNTLQKKFPFHFLFKVFHPPYFTFKQTHPKYFLSSHFSIPSLFSILPLCHSSNQTNPKIMKLAYYSGILLG